MYYEEGKLIALTLRVAKLKAFAEKVVPYH
jgi:hypothetical protein